MYRYTINVIVFLLALSPIGFLNAQDSLSPKVFKQTIEANTNAVLIDVRTPKEFEEGHLEKAKNIDFKNPNFLQKIDSLNRNTPIYLYCLAGSRSSAAAQKLKANGFTNIKQLDGGYLAWKNDNLPIATNSISKDEYTKDDLQKVLESHTKVLVDFNAPWCGPCLVLAPKIKKIEKEFTGKVFIERVNVDKAPALTQSMNIRSIPLLVLFENGKPIKALEGNQSLKEIRQFLQ
ncbi:MAG: hypothetical protein DI598_07440 [Pseudopedobacter saltans]|uniref:Thioredoxin n=1 Tax=Pseudopedobacter saltans TaxID=151895 RepID=A0A2W5F2J5_9SPHI|nr:MAG: hypothetical protein DI598_07440 [Pseudopedobacter saltans]